MFKVKKITNPKELYITIHQETNETSIHKEITSLADKIGVDRSLIYRKFVKSVRFFSKNGYDVYKCSENKLKSSRGGS